MSGRLTTEELVNLIKRVFEPQAADRALGVMVDLPDARVPDDAAWAARRAIAVDWVEQLRAAPASHGLDVVLVAYRNAHTNNGDLPDHAWVLRGGPLPACAEDMDAAQAVPMARVLDEHSILVAVTKFSSTAPLKMAAKSRQLRAATMPGFGEAMVPALRLDYGEINRRVSLLKGLLDAAEGADFVFRTPLAEDRLHLDLRHRLGHASGGLLRTNGVAGNLPSGEAYIVPYEGELPGDASRSAGVLPVQFGSEIVRYTIEGNKALGVVSEGPKSKSEDEYVKREPAYANLAELGLGVLAAFGVKPIGEILLDEKLGLHIAFGRSEHFGGQVGPKNFSSPDAIIHIDRVYVPETQPDVKVVSVDLVMGDGSKLPLIRDNDYVYKF